MKTGLSIVIPTYNMVNWLPVALESCLDQTDPDFEIIVINDGSTDNIKEITDAYEKADSRVRVIHQENRGLGLTRQRGQDEARKKYVTWLDADDFLGRSAVKDMVSTGERDNVDMVCGNAVVFSDVTFNTRSYFHHPAASKLVFDDSPEYWKSKVTWRWIINVDFLQRHNMQHMPYKMSQDVVFMSEALTKVSMFSQCPTHFYYFRQGHKSAKLNIETYIEHQLKHFKDVKRVLVDAKRPKPLVKYFNENYFRDIKKILPRLEHEDQKWTDRFMELGLEIFDGVDEKWFTQEFLSPELKCNEALVPLAKALIAKDETAANAEFEKWRGVGVTANKKAVDKGSTFHTIRRRLKAAMKPMSLQTRFRLRQLESRAAKRLGTWKAI
ncbi:MAG: glycosyltransferase family 2 protein [Desulfovibrio sp.]